MNFIEAIKEYNNLHYIARKGWDNKRIFLHIHNYVGACVIDELDEIVKVLNYEDYLADDWELVNEYGMPL